MDDLGERNRAIPPVGRLERFVLGLNSLLLRAFFRKIHVVGAERLVPGRPAVVVANHINGLIDPMLVLAALPRQPYFLGKSTLWNMRWLRPILRMGRFIPVYRKQDTGVDTSKNQEMFARSYDVLAAGDSLAIFPEGQSHNEPSLTELRTGAARILLGAEAKFGPLASRVVPVGLVFGAKDRFRSRVLVQVGQAIDPEREMALHGEDPVAAVRSLTERIDQALRSVTLNYSSWREATLIGRAADLFERQELDLPSDRALTEDFPLHRAFIEGAHQLRELFPDRVAAAADAVESYDLLLSASGLRDEQVAARYSAPSVLRFLAKTLFRQAIWSPLAWLGAVLNFIPYQAAGLAARIRGSEGRDQIATHKLFSSFFVYPLAWILTGLGVGLAFGWPWGLATSIASPLLGWCALSYFDRQFALLRSARAFLLLRTKKGLAEELRSRRTEAHRLVKELAELYRMRWDEMGG